MTSVRKPQTTSDHQEQELGFVSVEAMPDHLPTFAGTQEQRAVTKVTLFPPPMLDTAFAEQVALRLNEWDPFWETVSIVGMGVTAKVRSTTPETDLIKRAAVYNLSLPLEDNFGIPGTQWGKRRGDKGGGNGDLALLLRMLPADNQVYQKKRADCHLWPKGTFLQINGKKVSILQRKQQGHDEREWKGMSTELDVTQHIIDPKQQNSIQIFCHDDQLYVFVFSICKYRSVSQLYKSLTSPASEEAITVLPWEACFDKALHFARQQMTVAIDGDHGEVQEVGEEGKFVFSLLCPISKTIMTTPVRGRNCKHFQVGLFKRCGELTQIH